MQKNWIAQYQGKTEVRLIGFLFLLLVGSWHFPGCAAGTQDESKSAQPIRAVWTEHLLCSAMSAQALSPYPDAEQVKSAGAIELKQLGIRYEIPYVPKVDKFVVRVVLDDRSRGVIDNYILISDDDLKAPFGALVVTDMPPAITTAAGAFNAVDLLQRGLAGTAYASIERREINDARLGRGIEYITPNRVGSLCFPTSKYKFVPDGMNMTSIGISRFFLRANQLVELSYIVVPADSMLQSARNDFARSEMDRYLTGLTWTNSNK